MIVPTGTVVGLSAVLFGIGAFGFLARRNIILMLVSVCLRSSFSTYTVASRRAVRSRIEPLKRFARHSAALAS